MSNFLAEPGQPWIKKRRIMKEDKSQRAVKQPAGVQLISLDVTQVPRVGENLLPDSKMHCVPKESSTKGTTWLYILLVGKKLLWSERKKWE